MGQAGGHTGDIPIQFTGRGPQQHNMQMGAIGWGDGRPRTFQSPEQRSPELDPFVTRPPPGTLALQDAAHHTPSRHEHAGIVGDGGQIRRSQTSETIPSLPSTPTFAPTLLSGADGTGLPNGISHAADNEVERKMIAIAGTAAKTR